MAKNVPFQNEQFCANGCNFFFIKICILRTSSKIITFFSLIRSGFLRLASSGSALCSLLPALLSTYRFPFWVFHFSFFIYVIAIHICYSFIFFSFLLFVIHYMFSVFRLFFVIRYSFSLFAIHIVYSLFIFVIRYSYSVFRKFCYYFSLLFFEIR